jgi:hypothetical protein
MAMTAEFFTPSGSAHQKHHFNVDSQRWISVLLAVTWLLGLSPSSARGQTYLQNVGVPSFSKTVPVENGFIDASNGRLHLEMPLGVFPQRGGHQLKYSLMYDSSIWLPYLDQYYGTYSWQPSNINYDGNGWRLVTSVYGDINHNDKESGWCRLDDDYAEETFGNWTYIEPDGTQHAFGLVTDIPNYPQDCGGLDNPSDNGFATDASGYYMTVSHYTYATVYAPDGTIVYGGTYLQSGYHWYTDPNGNGDDGDTLGRTPVTTTVSGNTITYAVLNAQGGTSTYTVTTGTINVDTNFNQSSYTEYSGTVTAITEIDLPDGTKYTFAYDCDSTLSSACSSPHSASHYYGLLQSMKLRTGGQITYSWNVNTDSQGNKYPWISQRTTPDGTWTYTPSVVNTCS